MPVGRWDRCDWQPFLKAAFERNPVTLEYFHEMEIHEIFEEMNSWPDESIYSETAWPNPMRWSTSNEVTDLKRRSYSFTYSNH